MILSDLLLLFLGVICIYIKIDFADILRVYKNKARKYI